MCGEIDEQAVVGQDLLEQMRVMARMLGVSGDAAAAAPRGLADPEGRARYMEQVFRQGLARALGDVAAAEEDEAVDALAGQAIALARLAGFLAGQLPPEADLFRATVEALTAGHGEPRDLAADKQREMDRLHGHEHDDDHSHGHHHHSHHH
jgi:hypothetical protein